jgi:phosphohistidine phosphatase SixA
MEGTAQSRAAFSVWVVRSTGRVVLLMMVMWGATSRATAAQTLSGEQLVTALRAGGYVLVMRHASSPRQPPDKQTANADNVDLERQLDTKGRTTAAAMGQALHALKIPIGEVLTSPTYRAQETVHLAQLPNPKPQDELGDGGHSMQGITDAQADWLKQKVAHFPRGTNTILVTHLPNIERAFPQWSADLADGETLVFGPDGQGHATVVARVKIEEWPTLRR